MFTKCRMLRSFLWMTLLRTGREYIQSRDSAPFSQLTINSTIEKAFKLPEPLEALSCRHRLNKRRSNTGSSISFWRYPMLRKLLNATARTCETPVSTTLNISEPRTSIMQPARQFQAESHHYTDRESPNTPSGRHFFPTFEGKPTLHHPTHRIWCCSSHANSPSWFHVTRLEGVSH